MEEKKIWMKRLVFLAFAYMLYLWSWNLAFGDDLVLNLKGYLGQEEVSLALSSLEQHEKANTLILTINSTSGDLQQTLALAQKIYEHKASYSSKVLIYIDQNAIGPSAILPFLADRLEASLFVSWGDIPYGNESTFPSNLLSSRVESLIDPENPRAPLLHLLALTMSNPNFRLVKGDEGWKLAEEFKPEDRLISPKGETLVLNQGQLRELNLVRNFLSLNDFNREHSLDFSSEKETAPQESQAAVEFPLTTSFEEALKKHVHFNKKGENIIGYLTIDDRSSGINQSTWIYIKNALDYYKKVKPIFIILELNTPGGEVFAAQKISDALKDLDTQMNVPIIAYINNWAISAGAMLAYSSRFIVTAKDGSMGAAEPVIEDPQSGKMETASEKVNSALRTDFANRARFFGRNALIAEAMVDKDLIIVKRFGKIIKLDNESQIRTTGADADIIISPKGKLLTLDADQMIEWGVANLQLSPTKTDPITSEELSRGVWPANKNPIFKYPFFKDIPNATINSYQMDLKTQILAWLASPIVSSILFLALIVGTYLELSTPGFGIPGTIAVTALFLIILSSFSLEIAHWIEIILLFGGLAILIVEFFVFPTFGLLGFVGLFFFITGLLGLMIPGLESIDYEFSTQTFNAAGQAFIERLAWLSATLVLAFVLIALLARYFTPRFATFNKFILTGNEQEASAGYIAAEDPKDLPQKGARGEVAATLRPTGKITVGDKLYEAMSDGEFIEKGKPVIVAKIDGSTIVVRSLKEENEMMKQKDQEQI